MSPPRGGERTGKEGAWVKKGGSAGTVERPEDGIEEEEEQTAPARARGRGRQPREPRGRREKDGTAAEESTTDGRTSRGRGGRLPRASRRGGQHDNSIEGNDDVVNTDEAGEELSGSALLNMLKANPPKVTRYTKGELLSISHLPASHIKPVDLNPLIDNDNKESQLTLRTAAGGKQPPPQDPEGIADAIAARQQRRAARAERRHSDRSVGDEGEAECLPEVEQPQEQQHQTSAPSTPARGQTAAAGTPPAVEKPSGSSKAPVKDEESDVTKSSRAFDKWFDRKKVDGTAAGGTAAVSTPSTGHASFCGNPAAGQATASPAAGMPGLQASLLQGHAAAQAAQVHALTQAQAMQAYMQAMSMNAAAAVAAANRGAYQGHPPWGYNPYSVPYPYGPSGAGYSPPLDYSMQPQALQARLAAAGAAVLANAANALGSSTVPASGTHNSSSAVAGRGGTGDAAAGANKAAPKASQTAKGPASSAVTAPVSAKTSVEGPASDAQPRKPTTATDEEEDPGCAQS